MLILLLSYEGFVPNRIIYSPVNTNSYTLQRGRVGRAHRSASGKSDSCAVNRPKFRRGIAVRHGDVSPARRHYAPEERRLFTLTRPVAKDIRSFPRVQSYRNFRTHTFIIPTPFSCSAVADAPFVTPSRRTSECATIGYLHCGSVVKSWRRRV